MQKSVYTDLAMEARELDGSMEGIEESRVEREGMELTTTRIVSAAAARRLGKPMGQYVAIDAPALADRLPDTYELVKRELCAQIQELTASADAKAPVLAIGLGNRYITPDALGPRVVSKLHVTRHIVEYMPEILDFAPRSVAAVAPGVLGISGIETLEIVRGIVEKIKPGLVIAVDALASRRAERISCTVQLTDTGIEPGAGVGNMREGINLQTLGVPVLALGVPTVVYASTIAQDTIGLIAEETGLHDDEEKLKGLADKVIRQRFGPMIVTPKDIDRIVEDMACVVADAINMALHGEHEQTLAELLS